MGTTIPNLRTSRDALPPRVLRGAGCWGLLGLLLLLAGPAGAEEIVVSAAASLREPLLRVGDDFEAAHPGSKAAFSFGASSWLAAQIRAGAPVDVFLSADERQVASLEPDRVLGASRVAFAGNTLTLIVSPRAELRIATPADLAQPALHRFALPAAAVPLGHYARSWLASRGLIEALGTRVVQTADARATLAAVELARADAALVYRTDAALARRARVAWTPSPEEQPAIVYVGALTQRGAAKAAARGFLEFLLGPGRPVLERAGFPPPPEAP